MLRSRRASTTCYAAGHGFNCTDRDSYDAAAAYQAFQRTLEFFRKHLGYETRETSMTLKLKDPTLLRQQCYVDGQWLDATAGGTVDVTNPATGDMLGTVPSLGVA